MTQTPVRTDGPKCAICGTPAPEPGQAYTEDNGWQSIPGWLDSISWNPPQVRCPAHRSTVRPGILYGPPR